MTPADKTTVPLDLRDVKTALVSFYADMGNWYDALTSDGKQAVQQWVETEDITPVLPYLPASVAAFMSGGAK